nr:thymidylate synthase [Pirellula sp.]
GDVHLYNNHIQQASEQLSRTPKAPPTLVLRNYRPSILDYEFEDLELIGYDPHPHIPAPVAV